MDGTNQNDVAALIQQLIAFQQNIPEIVAQTLSTQLSQFRQATSLSQVQKDESKSDLVIDESSHDVETAANESNDEPTPMQSLSESKPYDQEKLDCKADKDAKYECPVCKKKYSRRWYVFGAHMRMHMGAKPFNCTKCKKTFNDRSNCRAHEKICGNKYKRHDSLVNNAPLKAEVVKKTPLPSVELLPEVKTEQQADTESKQPAFDIDSFLANLGVYRNTELSPIVSGGNIQEPSNS